MPDYPHYSNYADMQEAMIAFGQIARSKGFNVGIQETMDALKATGAGVAESREHFRFALKALFCCSEEDTVSFDPLFDWFWGPERAALQNKTTFRNQSNLQKRSKGSLVMLGEGQKQEEEEESRNVSGANAVERLRKTDFSKIESIESQWLEEIAWRLWKQMSLRLKRKMRSAKSGETIDLRKTIRHSIPHGGDPIELYKRTRKPRKQRLIILLDVSGSMDKYSFFLLRFLVALRMHFERIDAFIFSTKLICITRYLSSKDLSSTLSMLSVKADNWSSGTKIGACLQDFNEQFSRRVLNGHSTTIVLSDGLDTGDPALLAAELRKIKLRTRQLIWLNPLKGMQGYEPIQRGMTAALPEIDVFRPAHNLDSILELEKFLLRV